MLDISRDIHSLTDFKKNTSEFINQLKQTGEPLVLTINGKAELVVQDAAAYQKLRQVAEEARVLEGIRQGLEDMSAGRTVGLDEFKEYVRTKHAQDKGSRTVGDKESGVNRTTPDSLSPRRNPLSHNTLSRHPAKHELT